MDNLDYTNPGNITEDRPYFLVLGGWSAKPAVVEALRTARGYEAVTYVVMAATAREQLLRLVPPPMALAPDLGPGCERDARTFANILNRLGT